MEKYSQRPSCWTICNRSNKIFLYTNSNQWSISYMLLLVNALKQILLSNQDSQWQETQFSSVVSILAKKWNYIKAAVGSYLWWIIFMSYRLTKNEKKNWQGWMLWMYVILIIYCSSVGLVTNSIFVGYSQSKISENVSFTPLKICISFLWRPRKPD